MTIKEVAELAGVSTAAVSRYFNGGPLGKKKRQKIREVIEQTGYSPNAMAKTMRTGKSGQIGVILPRMQSESTARILSGIADSLDEKNYILLLGCTDGKQENEVRYLEAMQRNQVEGIILMGTVMTPLLRDTIEASSIPVVVTGQNFEGIPCVYHDDFNAARELACRMLQKGRKNMVFIGVADEDEAAGLARKRGVLSAWREAGFEEETLRLATAGFSSESGKAVMEELLKENAQIDAVLCASDLIALGAMRALRDAGKEIPSKVSIAGIGDSWADTIVEPGLTTAHLYYQKCGSLAVETLLGMLSEETEQPIRQTMLGYTIIERGTI